MDECKLNPGENRDVHHRLNFRFKGSSKQVANEGKAPDMTSHADERERAKRHKTSKKKRKIRRRRERDYTQKGPSIENENINDEPCLHDSMEDCPVDPEVAFRASLFDAMRDDEGAQFWEGVYGQPVHTYPNTKLGPDGKLERMTDDEYATYVRTKMYEKTHQYLIEERERRKNAQRQKEEKLRESAEQEREFRRNLEKRLRKDNERALRRAWSEKWDHYLMKWDILEKDSPQKIDLESIPWPVASGKRSDVKQEEIERFWTYAPTGGQSSEDQLKKLLKTERIRWHPDKIQQKLGGQNVNKSILQVATFVFQVTDRLWSQIQ
ncbi:hypothetical protein HI914_04913 [Erysiphe necator]|nr:hypothetical protein HI914_04913 [Erysiphe necator]